jgi:hypothetical protein
MSVGTNKETVLKFKTPLWSGMRLLFIGNLLGLIMLLPFIIKEVTHLSLRWLLILAGGLILWVSIADVIMCLILTQCFKVKLKPNGISCYNFWGIYSFVLWEEMRAVKMFNLFGLKYARVFFRNSNIPLWVPLFIKNRNEFSKALSEFAPPPNLLRQVFEKN